MKKQHAVLALVWTVGLAAIVSPAAAGSIKHVFVIPMENHDKAQIYGNTRDAPYIQTLLRDYASATDFRDELPDLKSEPHYIWMEAGTNAFTGYTFEKDAGPSQKNSTSSTAHLVTQIRKANLTWMSYQEGQGAETGDCPIASSGFYAAKHNPFVFFRDVSGDPPSKANVYCAAHHKPYSAFAADLKAGRVADYVFITPNLCHDMHGAPGCGLGNRIETGDAWLKSELPRLIAWADAHAGVIFLTWDEGSATRQIPFLAIGPGVKHGYTGGQRYDHGSIVKSVERIFGLPILATVRDKNDLSDLFRFGFFP